ncbi:MAG: hypothetical protein AB7I79_02200 [Rhizobiaceae bacterium]
MTDFRALVPAAAAASMLFLAGCMGGGGGQSLPPVSAAPTGVEGEWLSSDGVAMSRFNGGVFETVATDTGNKLAEGSYRYVDQRTVEITVISLIRQTTTAVNCALASTTQLNCTQSTGQQFILMRRPTV